MILKYLFFNISTFFKTGHCLLETFFLRENPVLSQEWFPKRQDVPSARDRGRGLLLQGWHCCLCCCWHWWTTRALFIFCSSRTSRGRGMRQKKDELGDGGCTIEWEKCHERRQCIFLFIKKLIQLYLLNKIWKGLLMPFYCYSQDSWSVHFSVLCTNDKSKLIILPLPSTLLQKNLKS